MIPIRDHNPSRTFPLVTNLLLVTNIVIFFLIFSESPSVIESLIGQYAFIPANITSGRDLSTLITSMFLHGSLLHLFSNMIFLNIFGDNLEDALGHFKFLIFYLVAGLGASFLQIASDPASPIPNLGASGAIAGVMGGYLFLFPNHKIDIWMGLWGITRIPAMVMLGYWIIFQIILGFGGPSDGVAYLAHVGGFTTGYLLTLITYRGR